MLKGIDVHVLNGSPEYLTDILNILHICELDNRNIETENFLLAVTNNRAIGCIRHKNLSNNTFEICSLGVLPEFRNRGIGKSLLRYKLMELTGKEKPEIYVVTVDNRIFIPFGFKTVRNPNAEIKKKTEWCSENLPVNLEYFAMKYDP